MKKNKLSYLLAFAGGILFSFLPFFEIYQQNDFNQSVYASTPSWKPITGLTLLFVARTPATLENTVVSPDYKGTLNSTNLALNQKIQFRLGLNNYTTLDKTNTKIAIGNFIEKEDLLGNKYWVTNKITSTTMHIPAKVISYSGTEEIYEKVYIFDSTGKNYRLKVTSDCNISTGIHLLNWYGGIRNCFTTDNQSAVFSSGALISDQERATSQPPDGLGCADGSYCNFDGYFRDAALNNFYMFADVICAEAYKPISSICLECDPYEGHDEGCCDLSNYVVFNNQCVQTKTIHFEGKVTENGNVLEGVTVKLERDDGTNSLVGTTGSDGDIIFSDLTVFKSGWNCNLAGSKKITCDNVPSTEVINFTAYYSKPNYENKNQPVLYDSESSIYNLSMDMSQTCGNGFQDGEEECDAGQLNGQPGVGCSNICMFEPINHTCPDFDIENAIAWNESDNNSPPNYLVPQECKAWNWDTNDCTDDNGYSAWVPLDISNSSWNYYENQSPPFDKCYFKCDTERHFNWDYVEQKCKEKFCENGKKWSELYSACVDCSATDIGKEECCSEIPGNLWEWKDTYGECISEDQFKENRCSDIITPSDIHRYPNLPNPFQQCKAKCTNILPANAVWADQPKEGYDWWDSFSQTSPWYYLKFDKTSPPDFYLPVSSERHTCNWECRPDYNKIGVECQPKPICEITEASDFHSTSYDPNGGTGGMGQTTVTWVWIVLELENDYCKKPAKWYFNDGLVTPEYNIVDNYYYTTKTYDGICGPKTESIKGCESVGGVCNNSTTLKIESRHCKCGDGTVDLPNEQCDAGAMDSLFPNNPYNGDGISGCARNCTFDYRKNTNIADVCLPETPQGEEAENFIYENLFQKQKCIGWDTSGCSQWEAPKPWTFKNDEPLEDKCDYRCNALNGYHWDADSRECTLQAVCGDGFPFSPEEECDHGRDGSGRNLNQSGSGCFGGWDVEGNPICKFEEYPNTDCHRNAGSMGIHRLSPSYEYWSSQDVTTKCQNTQKNANGVWECSDYKIINNELKTDSPIFNDTTCYYKCAAGYEYDESDNDCRSTTHGGDEGDNEFIVNHPSHNVGDAFEEDDVKFWKDANVPSLSRAGDMLNRVQFRFKLPDDIDFLPDADNNIPLVRWKITGIDPASEKMITLYSTDCISSTTENTGSTVCESDFQKAIPQGGIISLPTAPNTEIIGMRSDGKPQSIVNFITNPNESPIAGLFAGLLYPRLEFTFSNHDHYKKVLYQTSFIFDEPVADFADLNSMSIPDEKIRIVAEGFSVRAKQSIEVEVEPTILVPMFDYAVFQR